MSTIKLPKLDAAFFNAIEEATSEARRVNNRYKMLRQHLADRSGGPHNFARRAKRMGYREEREFNRAFEKHGL